MHRMSDLVFGPAPGEFIWATGVEDTFVPQTKPGHRALDEYALMGHYENWRTDLSLLRETGVNAVRFGIPWYRIEPSKGKFDWSWTDEVIAFLVENLGITPIIDLMHYGCPFWLPKEFANDDYPHAVADYSKAFAQRYKGLISLFTPLNEPLVNAVMCGMRGLWPPYLKDDSGYVRILLQIVRGVLNTIEALKEIDQTFTIVQVEATGLSRAVRHDLEPLAVEHQRRGYLYYDLITGTVNRDHPLFGWLLSSGATSRKLEEIASRRTSIDILGMNFYPQWSTQQIYMNRRGKLCFRPIEHDGVGFMSLIDDYYKRYRVPIMITETSAFGSDEIRSRWLFESVAAVKCLRARGVPILGYTWFPLLTMVDWRYRLGRRSVENYYIDLGLFKIRTSVDGKRGWDETVLVKQLRDYIQNPIESVGLLKLEA
jgi:beta-glucosidase